MTLLDDPEFGAGEFTALDLGLNLAIATEKVVHQNENQFRVEYQHPGAAQRRHFKQAHTGRRGHRIHVLGKLDHLDAADRDFRRDAQQVEKADPKVTRETIVNHLQGR